MPKPTTAEVTQLLDRIEVNIPVQWDRYTEDETGYCVYGWIKRDDGERDFALLQCFHDEEGLQADFVTSSARYSKKLNELLYGAGAQHNDCKTIASLFSG